MKGKIYIKLFLNQWLRFWDLFFEGSEKKIEIIFKPNTPSLRSMPYSYWEQLVKACNAQILSKVSNEYLDAYLLSESSLFVYDSYLIMITCGQTQLINSVKKILETFSTDTIQAFFYERKNEVFPHQQPSHVFEDLETLKKWFKGSALRFGREDEHHLYLYSSAQNFIPDDEDHTMEILMHGVHPQSIKHFMNPSPNLSKEEVRKKSKILDIVKGKIDDFIFDPQGYSLNSLDGKFYYTIHVTPQNFGNYTSFETNAKSIVGQPELAKKVLEVFKPASFDLILFNKEKLQDLEFKGYQLKKSYYDEDSSGYMVQYYSYFQPQKESEKAVTV